MSQIGRDERPGHVDLGAVNGYDRWAGSTDRDPNPLIAVEEPVVLELVMSLTYPAPRA